MKREQIIKGLECCRTNSEMDCNECHYRNKGNDLYDGCVNTLLVDALSLIKELTVENERLRAKNKTLTNDNAELKNEIQEAEFTEEEIDLLDEYTRLLNEGIRNAKANNVSEIKTRFAMRFGTYTDKDMTPITEVFRILDQITKEMEESK